ncbi:putative nucleotidyltransferase with HDIG domain [Hydrogenispora ethanolica]|jgi:putative nucleotidyltransferase with HDIG domain|uniref:Putative nucleotidyltransferase with HDIG domain n=1 Tax=Hydrogenispora ethanolica TaxID=1082276 RepID=A0A4R1R892_HYDET|nr:HD-GYP domain-containing protein [Hydrogenispora ethanolica]TCL61856.1 putative nucleotidyltransferase with HDIG domain [Hydrogenispora ethanolica]
MKKICFDLDIQDIKPGMIVGKNLFCDGSLLLSKGMMIKPSYVEHMKDRGVSRVTVFADKAYYEEILTNPVERFYTESYEAVSEIIDGFKKNTPPPLEAIFPVAERILEAVRSHPHSMLLLTGFRGICDYYYAHSLDVCIYSLIAAKALNWPAEVMVTLALGALLHDVGKTRIPDKILLKQGPLTVAEFAEAQKHARYGYEMVQNIAGIRPEVAKIVLQHHERCDGSGYPGGLSGAAISPLAKVVAVADIYDALTSDRAHSKRILPHEAAEYLLCISNSQIDSEIAKVFLKNIAIYPKGCQVLLNSNEVAVVLDPNEAMPLRPLLKILTDTEGTPLLLPFEFDLQKHSHTFITGICK